TLLAGSRRWCSAAPLRSDSWPPASLRLVDQAGGSPMEARERSLGELISDLLSRASILIQEEVALARAEMSTKVSTVSRSAGMLAGGGSNAPRMRSNRSLPKFRNGSHARRWRERPATPSRRPLWDELDGRSMT